MENSYPKPQGNRPKAKRGALIVLVALLLLVAAVSSGATYLTTKPDPAAARQKCLWEAVEAYPTTHPDKLKTMTSDLDSCKNLSSEDKTQVKRVFNDMADAFVDNLASAAVDPSGQGEATN